MSTSANTTLSYAFSRTELRTQTAGAVVKLHESRQEKFTALYQKQGKQWVDFFSSAKNVSKLKEITEVSEEFPSTIRFIKCCSTLTLHSFVRPDYNRDVLWSTLLEYKTNKLRVRWKHDSHYLLQLKFLSSSPKRQYTAIQMTHSFWRNVFVEHCTVISLIKSVVHILWVAHTVDNVYTIMVRPCASEKGSDALITVTLITVGLTFFTTPDVSAVSWILFMTNQLPPSPLCYFGLLIHNVATFKIF